MPRSSQATGAFLFPILLAISACSEREVTQPAYFPDPQHSLTGCSGDCEEEIFGFVYENGQRISTSNYYVMLVPEPGTRQRLVERAEEAYDSITYDSVMYVMPGGHTKEAMFGWFDVVQDCPGGRDEVHYEGPATPPDSTVRERHCVTAGDYTISLWDGNPEQPGAILEREIPVTYVQRHTNLTPFNTHTNSDDYVVEAELPYSPEVYRFLDLVISFEVDAGAAGSYSSTPVLRVDTIGASIGLEDATFTHIDSATAPKNHYFRFDASSSTSSEPVGLAHSSEGPLARLWYDSESPDGFISGYFDPHAENHLLRTLSYDRTLSSTGSKKVALDLLTPAQAPVDTPSANAAVVDIIVTSENNPPTLTASMSIERSTHVWSMTDQILQASATGGTATAFRWEYKGSSTAWTSSPFLDFPGHHWSDVPDVTAWVRDASGDSASATESFTVEPSQVAINGDTYISVKTEYTYTSNVRGDWWERFAGQDWEENLMWEDTDSIERVWAAGEYEVDLRQEGTAPLDGAFRRGRRHITVCIGCGPESAPQRSAVEHSTLLPLFTFGGGPLVVDGERVVPLYSLTGGSPGHSPFRQRDWLTTARHSDSQFELAGGGALVWSVPYASADSVMLDFALSDLPAGSTTGFTWDPDVGTDASNDRSGYDPVSGTVFVHDEGGAVGLRFERNGNPIQLGVQQFGARRLAPSGSDIASAVGDEIELYDDLDDVQYVITLLDSGSAYRVRLFRAGTVEELLAIARGGP
ncbi:MAG TPA: hypothetical protein VF039_06550 [Longimicrobiales bacterium]